MHCNFGLIPVQWYQIQLASRAGEIFVAFFRQAKISAKSTRKVRHTLGGSRFPLAHELILQVKQFRPQRTVKRKWMKRFTQGGLGEVLKYLWLRDDSFLISDYLFLSLTNRFYILMEFDSNGGLRKGKNRSPESRVKEGGWCRVALEKEAWLLRPDFSLPRLFTLPLPSRRLLIRSFFTNWMTVLEIIVVNICLLKLWCGEKWEVSEWTITQ